MFDFVKRKRVIKALKFMAEDGGAWNYDKEFETGAWQFKLFGIYGRRMPHMEFSQDDLRAFLKHYDEIAHESSL